MSNLVNKSIIAVFAAKPTKVSRAFCLEPPEHVLNLEKNKPCNGYTVHNMSYENYMKYVIDEGMKTIRVLAFPELQICYIIDGRVSPNALLTYNGEQV